MAFDNSDQPREADGRFGEKTGTAPDLTLSPFPEGFPTTGTTQQKVDWALENNAALDITVGYDENPTSLEGESLRKSWDMAKDFHVDFNVSGATIPPTLSDEVNALAANLRTESLDEAGVSLSDIAALREATNRAEYRLVEYSAEDYLAERHPEVRGLLVSYDAFSGDPYIIGVETSLPEPDSGRDYGEVRALDEGYEDIREWENEHSHYLQRFKNEEVFDEYAAVLTDENSEFGEFVDPSGPDQNLGLQDGAIVYRLGERY